MRKQFLVLFILLAGLGSAGAATEEKSPAMGSVIWHDDFANPIQWSTASGAKFHRGVPNFLRVEADAAGTDTKSDALTVQQDAFGNTAKTKTQSIYISSDATTLLKPYAGYEIVLSAEVRAQDIPIPNVPWEGGRVVLNFQTPLVKFGSSANCLFGSFDWKPVSFRTRIPTDLEKATVSLGLIGNRGWVEIRNLAIKVTDIPRTMRYDSKIPSTSAVTRQRGFSRCFDPKNKEFVEFWKANLLKHWMKFPDLSASPEKHAEWLKQEIEKCDRSLNTIPDGQAKLVIQVFLGKSGRDPALETDYIYLRPGDADRFVKLWEALAQHYKGNSKIGGFELLNESCLRIPQPLPGCPDYEELMERTALAINRIDPERTVIVQPEEWYGMYAFYRMRPIRARNVVYAIHFYEPFALTHQNLFSETGPAVAYPGEIRQAVWNRETLRRAMAPAVEFQRAYNVPMMVSEFSCIRWAPGAERWLDDAISLFEEYGWDWLYHDIYAWPGWDPTLEGPREKGVKNLDNPRALILRKWMSRNPANTKK